MAIMLGGLKLSLALLVVLALAVLAVLAVLLIRKSKKTDTAVVMPTPVQHESGEGTSAINENQSATPTSNPMMKRCPVCGREIAKTAKSCPGCGAKNKKPIYRRGWVILLVVVICIGAFIKINSASKDFILYIDETQEVKASTLSELAETDTATYNNRYFGKPVTFTAKITGTHGRTNYTNITKTYEYSLDFGDNITVGFSEPYNFSVGDEVTVIGTLSSCVYDDVYINGALVFK